MKPHRWQRSEECRIVVGADAVIALRSEQPGVPVVALVQESSPTELVRAQLAGADVVLTVGAPGSGKDAPPGLDVAIQAAKTTARRRAELAATSRSAGHDVAEALNVIGLTAEAGQHDRLDQAVAFEQIRDLVRSAGNDAWRVGRAHRSSSLVISRIDVRELFDSGCLPRGVEFAVKQATLVLADRQRLIAAIDELVSNARRAGAGKVAISVTADEDAEVVTIIISDDGRGFPSECTAVGEPFASLVGSDRLGIGMAVIAEQVSELGGSLELLDPGRNDSLTRVALSLPKAARSLEPGDSVVEPAAVQASILESVVRHAPLDESLEGIVAAIENQLPGTICSILLLHDGSRLEHGAGARLPLAYRQAIDGVKIGLGQGSCGTAAFTGYPVIASDVTIDPNWIDFRAIAIEHGLRSCWSTPIVAAEGGETLGTFAVYTSGVWRPDQAAIRLVNRFTYLAAVAIEHHRLFRALEESEARFRSAFEGAAAGIALASLDGVVLKANPALFDMVAHLEPRLTGISLLDLVDPLYRDVVAGSWTLLTGGGVDGDLAGGGDAAQPEPVEIPLVRPPDVEQKWVSLQTSLIPVESEPQPYLYIEIRDVTAARRQLADMRAREAAEAANRAKTDFLALASHELRTPLNAILGFAQVMQLLDLDDDQRGDSVEHIVNAGRHLRDLIDQLLDLSRIESGQLSVETAEVDASSVIDEVLELVAPLAAARDIELVRQVDLSKPSGVLADHRCMRQVLINLLDNAVKYTPSEGRVAIGVDQAEGSNVRITVTDSGPGISADSLDVIFQPFFRLDRPSDSESVGSGLGLALCSRLMREMDGSIGVVSKPGAGSTFWIELPAAAVIDLRSDSSPADKPIPNTPLSPRPGIEPNPPESSAGKVLYIEDDLACIDVLGAALGLRPEITLVAKRTAAQGAAALAVDDFNLVLLDIGLPDRSGWDLVGEIRATHPDLPVVVLTAGPDVVPVGGTQPSQVLTKPIDVHKVLRAIDLACTPAATDHLLTEAIEG